MTETARKLHELENRLQKAEDIKRRVFLKATINRIRTENGMPEKYEFTQEERR